MVAIPNWALELYNLHRSGVARQFVLHFNIYDLIIDLSEEANDMSFSPPRRVREGDIANEPLAFRPYLHKFLREWRSCQAIYTYSLAGGLIADEDRGQGADLLSREMSGSGWGPVKAALEKLNGSRRGQDGQPVEGREVTDPDLPDSPAEIFRLLGHLLRQKHYAQPNQARAGEQQEERPIAVIIDYAEKLMPVGVADGRSMVEQLIAVEVAQRWAVDPLIRETRNIIILLTTNLGQLAANIYGSGSGTREIRIPLPDDRERHAYGKYLYNLRQQPGRVALAELRERDFGKDPEDRLSNLSTITQGMRLRDIDNLNRVIIVKCRSEQAPEIITQGDVQQEKEKVIQAQSEQLLEVVPRNRGFTEIGGLESLKAYLRSRARLMKQRKRSPLVPSGLLLAGPPGTGKTIIAEALAKESGFNLVKMRNIQDRWVGSSERNLEMVINLLKDLYPVVVFIDEIDQAVGRRDTGGGGDSGVSGRMFARILEEMSNSANRGRILWIAATNRTDIIDSALLRRFDRVVPLLVPDERETARIYVTMPRTINLQIGGGQVQYGGDLAQETVPPNEPSERDLACFAEVAKRTVERGLTGAGIEIVVRRAYEIAEEEVLLAEREDASDSIPAPAAQKSIAVIQSKHLKAALDDYKPNHNRDVYDFQSLLAIQACNFLSVLPPLPDRAPFKDIYEEVPGGGQRISVEELSRVIARLRVKLASQPSA